jgi:hypothetical protein
MGVSSGTKARVNVQAETTRLEHKPAAINSQAQAAHPGGQGLLRGSRGGSICGPGVRRRRHLVEGDEHTGTDALRV